MYQLIIEKDNCGMRNLNNDCYYIILYSKYSVKKSNLYSN